MTRSLALKSLCVVGVAAALAVFALKTTQPLLSGENLLAVDAEYTQYMARYGRSVSTKNEFSVRRDLYAQRKREIDAFNAVNSQWKKGVNQFTDMTQKEIVRYTGALPPIKEGSKKLEATEEQLLASGTPVDWRSQFGEIKNQQSCGACWAFASVGLIESNFAIKHGQKFVLSEQQLVDCTKDCYGCDGGWIDRGLAYVRYNGIMKDSDYPYTASEGSCNHDYSKSVATVSDVFEVNDPKIAITNGPFGVYVNAVSDFASYQSGIYNGYCSQAVDHAVIIAGWGIENGIEYWIIRNSWSTAWGEAGYIRVQIGGNCYLDYSSWPVLA